MNLNLPREDVDLIMRIADRAVSSRVVSVSQKIHLVMDLAGCHSTCPLRLQELFEATAFNFLHDVQGVWNHFDRTTGRLRNFTPRYAAPKEGNR